MNRNAMSRVLLGLMLACGLPAYGANKEMIQLEEQVKLLGNQMAQMQQSVNEKLAALQADAEQTASNVKQISTWAAHVDATLKQQTADSDTCADQISQNSKVLRQQLQELDARLERIAKQIHDMNTAPASASPTAPPAAGANPAPGPAPDAPHP